MNIVIVRAHNETSGSTSFGNVTGEEWRWEDGCWVLYDCGCRSCRIWRNRLRVVYPSKPPPKPPPKHPWRRPSFEVELSQPCIRPTIKSRQENVLSRFRSWMSVALYGGQK